MRECKIAAPLSIAVLALLGVSLQMGCGASREGPGTVAAESAPDQPRLLTVRNDQLARLGISPVRTTRWSITVHATGTVDWDADHTTQAITQVNGPVSRILVDTGAIVMKGDPLLYVSSPDVASAISTYRKAHNQQDLAQRSLRRTQELLDRGAVAQKDLESAQAAFNDASTDVQNSLQALRIFGITPHEMENAEKQGVPISPELAVRAPIAGTIVQKLVSPGQLVQAGATICFMLSDVSTVWIQGHVFDRDLPSIHLGDAVEATNASFPEVFRGTISYVGAMVDPATRTTPVRIATRNPRRLLKKDMFVDAVIHTRTEKNVLTVPVSAMLRDTENEPLVYVEVQPGKFAQRLITIGAQQDDQVQVLSGLREGERVVSAGSIFIQFASNYQ
jgi:membrane fusion protein, heavy metal efflux system